MATLSERLGATSEVVAVLTAQIADAIDAANTMAGSAARRKADPDKIPTYVLLQAQIADLQAQLTTATTERDEIARAIATDRQLLSRTVGQDLAAHPSTYAAPAKWAHVVKHDDEPCWDRDLAPLSFEDTKVFSKWARGKVMQDPTWDIPTANYPIAALPPVAEVKPKGKVGRPRKNPVAAAAPAPMAATPAAPTPADDDDDDLFATPAPAAETPREMVMRLVSIGFTLADAMAAVNADVAKSATVKAPAAKARAVPVIKRLMPMVTKAQNEVIVDGIVRELSQRITKNSETKQVLLLECKDADGDIEMVHTWNNSTEVTFAVGQMVTAKGTVTCRWSTEAKMRGWQHRGPVTEIRSAAGDVTDWQG